MHSMFLMCLWFEFRSLRKYFLIESIFFFLSRISFFSMIYLWYKVGDIMFVPLKITTDYTLLESMITIPKLLLFLEKYQIKVCGICDKNLFGVMEFYDTMTSHDIKPLIGLQVDVNSVPLYLYARDYNGYQSLLKLSSIRENESLTIEEILPFEKNLNVILPYLFLEKYEEFKNFFSYLYIGYETEYEKNTSYTVTDHVLFCPNLQAFSKKDGEYLAMLKAINFGESVKLIDNSNSPRHTFEYYFKENFFDSCMEEFLASCNVVIPKDGNYIPKYREDSEKYLVALANKGLQRRLREKVPAI